jgi:hypothetical protein
MNKVKKILVPIILPAYLKIYKFYTLYLVPFKYKEERYLDSFISKNKKVDTVQLKKADEVIYVFWTGTNELTANRKNGLESLKQKAGVRVKLITPDNLSDYIVKGFPLHEGFKYLSLIQKSDYLRCYFMLHYGGGYADIKICLRSWKDVFDKLNNNDNKWVSGVREKYPSSTVAIEGYIGKDLKKYYNLLISNGAFVYKPNSPICKEWMQEVHARMDYYFEDLRNNPGGIYDENNYPIPWAYLAGHIMHPLMLKYNEKVIYDHRELFSGIDYR